MLEQIKSILQQVGQLVGEEPEARGAVALGGLVLALAGLIAGRLRRAPPGDHARIRVDAPKGERVRIEIGDSEDA